MRHRLIAAAALVGFLFVVIIGAAVGIQAAYGDRIYPGVRALGVAVGGLTRAEAHETLSQRAIQLANRSLTVGHEELRWSVLGVHLGVRQDVSSLVEEAYALGRDGNVLSRAFSQLGIFFGGRARAVRTNAVDGDALATFMQALAGAVDRARADAKLVIRPDGVVGFEEGISGRRLDVEATRARLEEAASRTDVEHVGLAVEEVPPAVRSADLADARAQAELLVSAPLVFRFEDFERELSQRQLASFAEIDATGVHLSREAVKGWVAKVAKDVDQPPRNARFTWNNGSLSLLRPSQNGRELDVERTIDLAMIRGFDQERVVPLPVSVAVPEVSQEDGHKLNIKGAVEVARTSFAGSSPPKQHNIKLASERLNGVVVPPGKLFSFNREIGSTSLDNGYKLGWGIANAGENVKTVPSVAGGICQVSTTLFHAVFWGGYQIEERNYHLYWIPGYVTKGMEGLDATVDEDVGLDFRFYNNTEDFLLIQSWTEGARVVFGLYGTKPDWTVKVSPGERIDVVEASKDQVVEDEPTLPLGQRLAVEGAMDGFKIINVRTVTNGGDPRVLRMTSVYRPSRNVTLVGTGGRPAGPSQTTATNRPTRSAEATPAPTTRATPSTGAQSASTATPVPSGPVSKPTTAPAAPTPAPTRAAPAPGATVPPANTAAPAPKPVIQPNLQPGPTRAPTTMPGPRTS